MTSSRIKLGTLALAALVSFGANDAVAHSGGTGYAGVKGADVRAGINTGYVFNQASQGGTRLTAHNWAVGGYANAEVNNGNLRGLYGEVQGRVGWAFSQRNNSAIINSRNGGVMFGIGGAIGYNVARWLNMADQNIFIRPLVGFQYDSQRYRARLAATGAGANINAHWYGPWVGAEVGGNFANVHSVAVRGAFHFVNTGRTTGTIAGITIDGRRSSGNFGFTVEGKYRYAINNRWGVDVMAGYNHRTGRRGSPRLHSFHIMGGVSATL